MTPPPLESRSFQKLIWNNLLEGLLCLKLNERARVSVKARIGDVYTKDWTYLSLLTMLRALQSEFGSQSTEWISLDWLLGFSCRLILLVSSLEMVSCSWRVTLVVWISQTSLGLKKTRTMLVFSISWTFTYFGQTIIRDTTTLRSWAEVLGYWMVTSIGDSSALDRVCHSTSIEFPVFKLTKKPVVHK